MLLHSEGISESASIRRNVVRSDYGISTSLLCINSCRSINARDYSTLPISSLSFIMKKFRKNAIIDLNSKVLPTKLRVGPRSYALLGARN